MQCATNSFLLSSFSSTISIVAAAGKKIEKKEKLLRKWKKERERTSNGFL